jgi:MFS family permease
MRAPEEQALIDAAAPAIVDLRDAPPPPHSLPLPPPPPPPARTDEVIYLPEAEPGRPPLGADFARVWGAAGVSNIGDGVRKTALPLLAAAVTRDPVAVSGILLVSFLPWLLFALPAGAMVDRLDRRSLVTTVSTMRALVMAVLCGLVFLGEAGLPVLYAVAFLQGIGEVFSDNAVFALVPGVVPKERLEDANGRLEAVILATNQFAGPALGGLLFAQAAGLPFLVDAGSFVVMASLIGGLKGRGASVAAPRSTTTIRADIAEGVRWLRARPSLRNLSYIAALTNLSLNATFGIFVLFALEELHLSAFGFGILLSIEAVGALAGSLLARRIRERIGIPVALACALALAGAANLVLAVAGMVPLVAAMMIAVAFAGGVWNVLTNSLRQAVTPDRLLGRVQSAHRLLSWGAVPFGTLLGGALAGGVGLRAPFLVAGVVLGGLAVAAFMNSKHLRPDYVVAPAV